MARKKRKNPQWRPAPGHPAKKPKTEETEVIREEEVSRFVCELGLDGEIWRCPATPTKVTKAVQVGVFFFAGGRFAPDDWYPVARLELQGDLAGLGRLLRVGPSLGRWPSSPGPQRPAQSDATAAPSHCAPGMSKRSGSGDDDCAPRSEQTRDGTTSRGPRELASPSSHLLHPANLIHSLPSLTRVAEPREYQAQHTSLCENLSVMEVSVSQSGMPSPNEARELWAGNECQTEDETEARHEFQIEDEFQTEDESQARNEFQTGDGFHSGDESQARNEFQTGDGFHSGDESPTRNEFQIRDESWTGSKFQYGDESRARNEFQIGDEPWTWNESQTGDESCVGNGCLAASDHTTGHQCWTMANKSELQINSLPSGLQPNGPKIPAQKDPNPFVSLEWNPLGGQHLVVKIRDHRQRLLLLCSEVTTDLLPQLSPGVRELERLSRAGHLKLCASVPSEEGVSDRLMLTVMAGSGVTGNRDDRAVVAERSCFVSALVQELYPSTVGWAQPPDSHWLKILAQGDGDMEKLPLSNYKKHILRFYRQVKAYQKLLIRPPASHRAIPHLMATLLGYQESALCWMLAREKCPGGEEADKLHVLWREVDITAPLEEGEKKSRVYYSPFTGRFSPVRIPASRPPLGGILADEMGLGKTVEILALILSHRWCGERRERSQSWTFGSSPEALLPQEHIQDGAVQKELSEENVVSASSFREQFGGSTETEVHSSDDARVWDSSLHSRSQPDSDCPTHSQSGSQAHANSDTHDQAFPGSHSWPGSQPDGFQPHFGAHPESHTHDDASPCSHTQPGSQTDSSHPHSQTRPESHSHGECVPEWGSVGKESSGVMWCVCGAEKMDGRDVVQCVRCGVWHHCQCADYNCHRHSSFICVRCLIKEPLACGTTLVIVPESLLAQWMDEIDKHTQEDSLQVLHYRGVASEYLNPVYIVASDVVLVTYETLKLELHRVQFHDYSLVLRRKKKYSYPPSPLLAIRWWRIVLDEAQVVESVTAKAAEMTHRLVAVNRWCVTGTPVQRDLRDLYGLVCFLKWSPFSESRWWSRLVWSPYVCGDAGPLVALFARLMWRNAKEEVADELSLPEIKEETHWLTFSDVELYFYTRQQEVCLSQFSSAAAQLAQDDVLLSDLDRRSAAKLLAPLHSLRQACCHPQLIRRGGYLPFTPVNKRYITMEELLKKLVTQAKQEGRESLRQLVAAFNGLAGILCLLSKYDEAVGAYRDAMEAWKSYEGNFQCDSLQRIHTMENLATLLAAGHTPLTRTLEDDCLEARASELRQEYLSGQESLVRASVRRLSIASSSVRKKLATADRYQSAFLGDVDLASPLNEDMSAAEDFVNEEDHSTDDGQEDEEDMVDGRGGIDQEAGTLSLPIDVKHFATHPVHKPPSAPWWMSLISWIDENAGGKELLTVLDGEMRGSGISWSFSTLSGLQFFLLQLSDRLKDERQAVLEKLTSLSHPGPLSFTDIAQATNCHLRPPHHGQHPTASQLPSCDYCQADEAIKGYETVLFSRYHLSTDDSEMSRQKGSFEKFLNCLLSFGKARRAPSSLCNAGYHHLRWLESMRKEFKHIRELWLSTEQRVKAHDELNMAATTFRLASLKEELEMNVFRIERDPFAISQRELHPRKSVYECDCAMFGKAVRKCEGQLAFLQNLSHANHGDAGEENQPCPICTQELTDKWAVLPCGHSLCLECVGTLVRRSAHHDVVPTSNHRFPSTAAGPTAHFACPMCRQSTSSRSINYVNEALPTGKSTPAIKGSYSTKISAVTRTLLGIRRKDPRAKSLVFSCSQEVLKLISFALKENDIAYTFLTTKKELKSNLPVFKASLVVNILLVFMAFGSKGLNIVEATHVLLVEPSLNMGAELQAIGRTHRLGQTKPTTVHRFYVRNTVEERIWSLVTCPEKEDSDGRRFVSSSTGDSDSRLTVAEIGMLFADSQS